MAQRNWKTGDGQGSMPTRSNEEMVQNPADVQAPITGGSDMGEGANYGAGSVDSMDNPNAQMTMDFGPPGTHAPVPQYPEKPRHAYLHTFGENRARRGALRFQEGVETDMDIPSNFVEGVTAGNMVNLTHRKWPEETLRERAHVGSASWIEAPSMLDHFVVGSGEEPQRTNYEFRDGTRQQRWNPVNVQG